MMCYHRPHDLYRRGPGQRYRAQTARSNLLLQFASKRFPNSTLNATSLTHLILQCQTPYKVPWTPYSSVFEVRLRRDGRQLCCLIPVTRIKISRPSRYSFSAVGLAVWDGDFGTGSISRPEKSRIPKCLISGIPKCLESRYKSRTANPSSAGLAQTSPKMRRMTGSTFFAAKGLPQSSAETLCALHPHAAPSAHHDRKELLLPEFLDIPVSGRLQPTSKQKQR